MLCTNLEFYQFVKIPILFEHFQDHKSGDSQITFLEYLKLHYKDGQHKDADYNADIQLPFQTSNTFQALSSAGYILPQNYTDTYSPGFTPRPAFTFYAGFVPESLHFDIFQPPRFS